MKTAFAALLSSKVLAGVAVAATATGGIALAASHGPLSDGSTNPTGPAAASATPSPNLAGLCTAYGAGATDNAGKASDNPAFQALVTAAGGADSDHIDAFCASLPSHLPTQATDHPTGKPTDLPTQATDHPTGKPTDLPSQATDHSPEGQSGATTGRP